MLHVASQGDAARSIYVFIKEKQMDINVRDNQGGTPLHWACHTRSEMALSYLLSFNPALDVQDHEGSTALHLAVKSVEPKCRTRCVRYLLLKGARTDIKDNRGKVPGDYIKDIRNMELKNEVSQVMVSD